MTAIKEFLLSLISAAAVTLICEGIIPEGGLKKYLKYIFALFILIVLLSPVKDMINGVKGLTGMEIYSYNTETASEMADAIVARHIKTAICQRFSISEGDISVAWQNSPEEGKKLIIELEQRFGLVGEDILYYTANNFGVAAEVIFYE